MLGQARAVLLAAVIVCFVIAAHQRNAVYYDEIGLWTFAVGQTPEKARPHYHLGKALLQAGRDEEALREMRAAVLYSEASTLPSEHVYSGLAVALLATKHYDDAFSAATRALAFNPRDVYSLNTLGEVLFAKGEYRQAASFFERALERAPRDAAALWNAAVAWEKSGRYEQARRYALSFLNAAEDERSRGEARELLEQIAKEQQGERGRQVRD